MSLDLEALEWRIKENAEKGFHVAPVVLELIAELKEARKEVAAMRAWAEEAARAENENAQDAREERAAVVAWLRRVDHPCCHGCNDELAADIERGEHRKEAP